MSPFADYASGLPTLTQVSHTTLPGDVVFAPFSFTNEVLFGRENTNTMTKYKFMHKTYQVIWDKASPEGMAHDCRKFISPAGDIILCNMEEAVIHIYSGHLKLKAIHTLGDMVLQAVTHDKLLYERYDEDGRTVVDVYTMDQEFVHRIHLPKSKDSSSLSVCVVPGSGGNVMVTDSENNCLSCDNSGWGE